MFGPYALGLVLPIPKNLLVVAQCVLSAVNNLHDDVEKDIEVDEDEKDDDGNKLKVLLDDEKAYANAADQYYKDIDGYVYNPATL